MTIKKTARKPTVKKTCLKCRKEQAIGNFYNTSDTYFYPDNKLDHCKACCLKLVEEEGFEGFQTLMRLINKPIYNDLFKGDHGDYIRMMNSMPQYKNLYYNNSDMFKENKSLEITKRAKPKELSSEDLKESEDFWGVGRQEHEYIYLNDQYQEYLTRYGTEDSKAMEDLIEEICLTKLDIRIRRANNQDVDKQQKTLQDLLGSSNLKPNQESGANSVEHETFGTLIKKWENERPIPAPDPEWEDVNGIRRLIIWFTGHMATMAGAKNPFQKEYESEIDKYEVFREAMEDE